ncbi:hypothetical protein L6R46_28170 [Myxococcota bacterium]|nr:hypothetical protein [Myxococcota bacterium]
MPTPRDPQTEEQRRLEALLAPLIADAQARGDWSRVQQLLSLMGMPDHHHRSVEWLRAIQPFGWYICLLTFSVIMLPFFLVMLVHSGDPAAKLKDMMDWAKTVLPPVIGFASALVGYLFGMRTAQPNSEAPRPTTTPTTTPDTPETTPGGEATPPPDAP